MKARDVEQRLQIQLPTLTDKFTNEVAIDSITSSGTTATATTASAHGLTAGKQYMVVGTNAPIAITSIERAGIIATVTTTTDHDLTEAFFTQVVLSGAVEAEFNGTFTLLTVPNRRKFTIGVANSGPTSATGSPLLQEPGEAFGYDGLITVLTTPTSTTFTYTISRAQTEPAVGDDMRVIVDFRIYSAIDEARANKVFEPRDINNQGQLVLVVVLGDVLASRDRLTQNDAVSSGGPSGSNKQQVIEVVSCLVYRKTTEETSGADARDDMQDTVKDIIRSLVGFRPPPGFAVDSGNVLKFVNHAVFDYSTALYTHVVQFQLETEINTEDLNITPFSVAFRDIAMTLNNTQGDEEITAAIDLDDEPL